MTRRLLRLRLAALLVGSDLYPDVVRGLREARATLAWAARGEVSEEQRAQMMEKAEITAALVERVPRWAVMGEVTLRMPMSMRLDSLTIKSSRTDPATCT